ncbi:ABC transporter permease [Pseudomonas sp. GOM6]|uniref:ABC transporter permease n=1 Tax=Pseudomonas sp. GOM6 TaxID=3036944 RepID=UPI00240A5A1D|nr:ABC transporter permease [Pseudomonas sp. GOM6]MDG1581182.1 ABC transporter permease [Pseudomonas sp. GOM6]
MLNFPATPREITASLWRNRSLINASIKREVLGRYRGSMMGLFWSFFNPMFMLMVYTLVFSVIFQARWSAGSVSKTEYALLLFAGLLIFNIFAECINRAPSLIVGNTNYVKKVVFPLEILPWVTLGAALFHGLVSLSAWLIAYMIFFGPPHVTLLYLPLIILPFGLFIMGLSWALASLGVYLRDVGQFISLVTTALMFLSPIFYPASAVPENYRYLLFMNPLTPIIEQARDLLFWGKAPDFAMLGVYLLITSVIAWLGFAWFQKTRKGFADVL